MPYFCESFEYQPIKLFLNSNAADIAQSHGNITFDLRRSITLPNGTIGYVSLNELTVPNTNYNMNGSNNTLDFCRHIQHIIKFQLNLETVMQILL